jgi:hypothetical protein
MRSFLEEGYARGFAIGRANIRDDTITFRYKDEVKTVPIIEVDDVSTHNGSFYEMPLAKFRKLKNGRL